MKYSELLRLRRSPYWNEDLECIVAYAARARTSGDEDSAERIEQRARQVADGAVQIGPLLFTDPAQRETMCRGCHGIGHEFLRLRLVPRTISERRACGGRMFEVAVQVTCEKCGGTGQKPKPAKAGAWHTAPDRGLVMCLKCRKTWGHDIGGAGPLCPGCGFEGDETND